MSSSAVSEPKLAEPLFIGGGEMLGFGFLFLSPWLGDEAVRMGWVALVLMRIFFLAGYFYYGGLKHAGARLRFLGRVVAYGVPFWVSSLFFPLRQGQAEQVFLSLKIYLALLPLVFFLSWFKVRWFPALICLLTLFWFHSEPSVKQLLLPVLLSLSSLLWPVHKRSSVDRSTVRACVGLGGVAWSMCLFFEVATRPYGMRALSQAILLWFFLSAVATTLLSAVKAEQSRRADEREVELGLPFLFYAQRRHYAEKVFQSTGAWLPLIVVTLWGEAYWYMGLVPLLAFVALLSAAARGEFSEAFLPWWCCGYFVILWGMVEGGSPVDFACLGVALVVSLAQFGLGADKKGEGFSFRGPSLALEARLREDLVQAAPAGFLGGVLSTVEPSVDIDGSLASSAPTGFRERLLERFRQAGGDDDEVSE